nr:O-antigen ligase family protein [Acholeplasmatales bacterium]
LYLSILLVLEILFFMLSKHYSPIYMIKEKALDLGWGIHNAVAMIFLTVMPLCIYRAFNNIKKNWYYLLYYIFLFLLEVFIVCKGGVLAALIGSIIAFIGLMYFAKEYRKPLVITFVSFIAVAVLGLVIVIASKSSLANHLNLNNWFSRTDIWTSALKIFKQNPIFGIGLVAPCGWSVSLTFPNYQFAHNTFIEILVIGGIFGTLCFLYHLVEKYSRVLYKFNFKKFIILLFFLYPALYGLIDNTYLEITYTIYFLFALCVIDKEFEGEEIKWLIHFNKNDKASE